MISTHEGQHIAFVLICSLTEVTTVEKPQEQVRGPVLGYRMLTPRLPKFLDSTML